MRERMQTFAVKRGCALRLRWVKLAPKSSVLFWIRDKGGETHPIRVSVAPRFIW